MPSTFFRVTYFLFVLLIVAASAYGVLFSFNEAITKVTSIHVGGTFVLAVVLYGWYLLNRKSKPLTTLGYRLYITGVVLLSLPLIYYLWIGSLGSYRLARLAIFDKGFVVASYEESNIEWPGFDKPVGLRITMQLQYPFPLTGFYRYPKLLQGTIDIKAALEAPMDAYWNFCDEPVVNDTACITYPLWPIHSFPEVVEEEGKVQLSYELYPSNLYYRDAKNRMCLKKRYPYGQISSVNLFEVVMLWHWVTPHKTLDLSQRLTDSVNQHSELLKDVDVVHSWYQNFQSEAMLAAGYQTCEVKEAIRFNEEIECFCRAGDDAANASKE